MVGGGAEGQSGGGRCVGRWKMHWKVEDASGAEAESKSERCGIRGFPLQLPPLQKSIASLRACKTHWKVPSMPVEAGGSPSF